MAFITRAVLAMAVFTKIVSALPVNEVARAERTVALASAACIVPDWPMGSSNTSIPPKLDPWYTAPRQYDHYAPGAVLKIRSAPGNLASTIANCSTALNVMYRTKDSRCKPTWAVTTILVPSSTTGNALLSYQEHYDSADLDASPSYALYTDVPADITGALAKGWFVSVPDYEGPLASFTAGVISGQATLDSVRAARCVAGKYGLSSTAKYAMWGYSGGALASEWAAELQPLYAPELCFAGVALGGLTPNVSSVMYAITGTVYAGLIPQSIMGLSSQFPKVQRLLLSRLKETGPYNRTMFTSVVNMTLSESLQAFLGQDIAQYFVGGFADLRLPEVQATVNSDGLMGRRSVPQMPLYLYKAVQDLLSPVADTDALVEEYCAHGANILYDRNTIGGHAAEESNGQESAVSFLDSVLGGTYASKFQADGCTVRNVSIAVVNSPFRRGVHAGSLDIGFW